MGVRLLGPVFQGLQQGPGAASRRVVRVQEGVRPGQRGTAEQGVAEAHAEGGGAPARSQGTHRVEVQRLHFPQPTRQQYLQHLLQVQGRGARGAAAHPPGSRVPSVHFQELCRPRLL